LLHSKNILLIKLDEFIRKYYKNQLLKGLIYTLALLLGAFLFLVITEYFANFQTTIRTILFYLFIITSGIVITNYILIPVLKLNKFGKIISYDDAATIVGKHFSAINDKLINTLQLQRSSGSILSIELLNASINQKMEELNPIPFSSAINLSHNKKYLKYALPPVILFLLIFTIKPGIITDGAEHLLYHQTYFEQPAPFQFSISNKNLIAIQQQDFILEMNLKGNEIPNEVFITVDGIEHKMEKIDNLKYTYTFNNVQKNIDFNFNAAGFNSKQYELSVLPKPILIKFNTQLIYPAYLNKKNETLSNIGDLQLPQGTKIKWTFFTKNTEIIYLNFIDSIVKSEQTNDDEFSFSKQVMQSVSYSIKTGNDFLKQNPDSINYSLNVIPDQIPAIDVSEKIDSLNTQNIYFSGSIKDDYGFTRLIFKYTLSGKDSLGNGFSKQNEIPIGINKQNSTQPYFYFFNAANFNLQPGDKIEYYFEVWDNDGVNGSKSAKTNIMLFKAPSIDDINKATDKNNSETKKDINDEIKKAKDLQKDITDFSKKLAEKKQMGYEEKKKLEDILKKQNELKNKIEQTKQENQLNNKQQEELTKNDEALLEKQKQLEELFENIMTPEMKKLFDELNKMLDKLDKNQVQEKLEELKLSNKDMEKELDRTLEAFKQMEVEQKMQQAIDKLDDIKNKQDELKKETEGKEETKEKEGTKDAKTDNQKLEEKQKELNKKFDDLKKDIKDLEQKNDALEQKNEIPKTEEKQNEISKDMQQSADELNKKNKKEAAKSEKEASDGMQEMKEQMQKSMDEMEKEEQEEDMQALRQILENLLNLSFGQEDLMTNLSKLRTENPQYLNVPKKQRKLQDDSKIVEDSLFALSKRNPAISATVNREISSIIMNMKKTVNSLEERQQADAQTRMQYSMTSINNLALLLNESLEQMQQKAKEGKKDGSGKCKKPGKGAKPSSKPGDKPSMQSMKQMQEQLNKQIEELKKALEKGQKPGGEKPGNKPGEKPGGKKPGGQGGMGNQGKEGADGMPGLSQQLAKAAAQQEALRRQMQQMLDKIKKDGGNNPGGNLAEMMEQTERDIVNRQITQETMKRQQDIITKLLESDKAEREREQDEKRKSNEAKNQNLSNPTQFLEYKRLKEKELELLNTVPPSLTPYYKDKVNNYFNNVNK
jgi:hypothetical protein